MNQARTAESTYHHLGAHNVYYVKLTTKVLYFSVHIHT